MKEIGYLKLTNIIIAITGQATEMNLSQYKLRQTKLNRAFVAGM